MLDIRRSASAGMERPDRPGGRLLAARHATHGGRPGGRARVRRPCRAARSRIGHRRTAARRARRRLRARGDELPPAARARPRDRRGGPCRSACCSPRRAWSPSARHRPRSCSRCSTVRCGTFHRPWPRVRAARVLATGRRLPARAARDQRGRRRPRKRTEALAQERGGARPARLPEEPDLLRDRHEGQRAGAGAPATCPDPALGRPGPGTARRRARRTAPGDRDGRDRRPRAERHDGRVRLDRVQQPELGHEGADVGHDHPGGADPDRQRLRHERRPARRRTARWRSPVSSR